MYNKLFTKILDSSIWLEPMHVRIVWVTMLAAMDEDSFVALSTVGNVAKRANVTDEQAADAISILEGPDRHNPEQEHEGKRLERVDRGWLVINGPFYRDLVKRELARQHTRERVARHRLRNATVTPRNGDVTPSDQDQIKADQIKAEAEKSSTSHTPTRASKRKRVEYTPEFEKFWETYAYPHGKGEAFAEFQRLTAEDQSKAIAAVEAQKVRGAQLDIAAHTGTDGKCFVPHARTWLHQRRFDDEVFVKVAGAPRSPQSATLEAMERFRQKGDVIDVGS